MIEREQKWDEQKRDAALAAVSPPPGAAQRAGEAVAWMTGDGFPVGLDEAGDRKGGYPLYGQPNEQIEMYRHLVAQLKRELAIAKAPDASPAPAQGCSVCNCTRTHCAVCCENGNLSRPAQGYAEGQHPDDQWSMDHGGGPRPPSALEAYKSGLEAAARAVHALIPPKVSTPSALAAVCAWEHAEETIRAMCDAAHDLMRALEGTASVDDIYRAMIAAAEGKV